MSAGISMKLFGPISAAIWLGLVIAAPHKAVAQTPTPSGQQLEFRQLHPDARKLLVDEIRLQVQAENEKKLDALLGRAELWAKIASSILGVLVAILAFLGWRGLASIRQKVQLDVQGFLRSDPIFQADLSKYIDSSVRNIAESKYEKLRREVNLARLEMLSRKIEAAESFSNPERDAMVELLLGVSDDSEIRNSAAFSSTAVSVLTSLTAAELDASVDDLDDKLRDTFVKNQSTAIRLMHHYGERVLEQDEPLDPLEGRFRAYVAAMRRHKTVEVALPYLLAIENARQSANSKKRIKGLLEEVKHLNDGERNYIRGRFDILKKEAPGDSDGVRSLRERAALTDFVSAYGNELDKALGKVPSSLAAE